jgi:hypothetical protein
MFNKLIERFMPKKKSTTVKLEDLKTEITTTTDPAEVVGFIPADASSPDPLVETSAPLVHVAFEGAEVIDILSYGETPTHFHCRLSNGTTAHVPKSLFNTTNNA